MDALSTYLANALLNHVFGLAVYTPPTQVFVGLFTDPVGDDFSGAANEVSQAEYVRIPFDAGATLATLQQLGNAAVVQWPARTASWGTITHVALLDAATGGNVLFHGELQEAKVAAVGADVKFPLATLIAALT